MAKSKLPPNITLSRSGLYTFETSIPQCKNRPRSRVTQNRNFLQFRTTSHAVVGVRIKLRQRLDDWLTPPSEERNVAHKSVKTTCQRRTADQIRG